MLTTCLCDVDVSRTFYNLTIIRGESERAPNTRETGSGVYIYLFVRDLAWQRLNAHAQTPRGSLP